MDQQADQWSEPVAQRVRAWIVRNRLLLTLCDEDIIALQPRLERVPLPVGTRLVEPNTAIEHVYFLEQGIASVLAATPQGGRIEVGIIGREGLTGIPVLLGMESTPQECFIQTPGEGLRIRADDLRLAMAARPSLQQHLLRFVQVFVIQMGQTALANACHVIEQRLARWLVMCHDRLDGDMLSTTHEFLSLMLGVRRAGVTLALQALEDRGVILAKRRQIIVLNRAKLEAMAGDSYGVPEAEYARIVSRAPAGGSDLSARLYAVLDATMNAQGADAGNIQLYDHQARTLSIVAHRGFSQEFLDYFATVEATDASACGQALKSSTRIIIEDTNTDPSFAPHRAIAASSGFRAVQSTPLLDSETGAPVGMLSTHFRARHRPSHRELCLTDLQAEQAAGVIASSLASQRQKRV